MAQKRPAVLFYTSDFLTGTYGMSDAAVGRYIKLLCLQHQRGHLTKSDFFKICKKSDHDVISKFKMDEDGCYFNERMDVEIEKRQIHSEKQRQNVMKRWNGDGNSFGNTTVLPLDNDNDNENIKELREIENRGYGGKEEERTTETGNSFSEVLTHYQNHINSAPNRMVRDDITEFLKTMEPAVIKSAIDRAAAEGKRQHSYIRGILRSWRDKNVQTMADVARADEEWQQRKQAKHAERERKVSGKILPPQENKGPTREDMGRMQKILEKIRGEAQEGEYA